MGEILGAIILSGMILFTFVVTFVTSFQTVPQGFQYLVERLGKYERTLDAGPQFILPFVELVAHKIDMREQLFNFELAEVWTADGAAVQIKGVVSYQIKDPVQAIYGVQDYPQALRDLIENSAHQVTGSLSFDELLAQPQQFEDRLFGNLQSPIEHWGIQLHQVKPRLRAIPSQRES